MAERGSKSDTPQSSLYSQHLLAGVASNMALSVASKGEGIESHVVEGEEIIGEELIDYGPLIKEGLIWKQGPPPWKSWKKRWCVLTKNIIEYWKPSRNKPKASMKGRIPVGIITGEPEVLAKAFSKRHFSFKISTPQRVYFFACDTQAEMNEWIQSIVKASNEVDKSKNWDEAGFGSLKVKKQGKNSPAPSPVKAIEPKSSPQPKGSPKQDKPKTPTKDKPEKEVKPRKRSEAKVEKAWKLPTDEEIKKLSSSEVKELQKILPQKESQEIQEAKAYYLQQKNIVLDELVQKEIEIIIEKYERERNEILKAIKEKGGGDLSVVPSVRGRGKSSYNRSSIRRANLYKK